jgi:hypothetical protein
MAVLSRVQQNDIFQIAQGAGLDPLEFDWSTANEPRRGLVETFRHRPTQCHMGFSSGDRLWVNWWPRLPNGHDSLFCDRWNEVLPFVAAWIGSVKENHDAPDLWAEAAKARGLTDAVADTAADNTPFSAAEIEALKPQLNEVEAYIHARQPLNEGQTKTLHARFQYLLDAAKRGVGRIDWLNILVAQILSLFTNGTVHPSIYGDVMRHAFSAIGSVWQHAARLLGP